MKGFKVRKAAQVAAYFALAEGGRINVLKLIKLIYLADRRFMEKYDTPILNDCLVSMDHGPVNSMTLNYVNGLEDQRDDWDEFITDRDRHSVGLTSSKISVDNLDELSVAEIKVLEEIAKRFERWNGYMVRDYTHNNCPEWENPHGSSNPIPYERVLKFLHKKNSAELAENIQTEIELDGLLTA